MKIPALLLSAALLTVAVPSGAEAHLVCIQLPTGDPINVPGEDPPAPCQPDAFHSCVDTVVQSLPAIVCVGTHLRRG